MFARLAKTRLAKTRHAKTRLARSGLAKLWPVQPRHIAARLHEIRLFHRPYSNDNLPGLRHPKGQRRVPSPALTCHWLDRNGRLECCWHPVDTLGGGRDENPYSPSGLSAGERHLARHDRPASAGEDFT